MVSDGALLAIAFVGLSLTISIVLYFAGFFRGNQHQVADGSGAHDEAQVLRAGGRRAGGLAALRKRKEKKKKDRDGSQRDGEAQEEQVREAQGEAIEGDETINEPRPMTKKELQKEMKRREREEMRRFEEQQREEQRQRAQAKEEALAKKREEEALLEQREEEEAQRLAEEKAKKEQEEFEQWKDMFTVEDQGSKIEQDSAESQELLQQFVMYIEAHKVVVLEDLAGEFELSTHEVIQRVQALQESNRITGIIDDRGKFIFITEEEMDKVARLIERKGRLTLTELSKECNKLIKLESEKEQTLDGNAVDWLNQMDKDPNESDAIELVGVGRTK